MHTHKPPVLWKFMSRTRSCVGILFIISVILGIVLGYMVLEGIAGSEPLEPISPFTDTTSIPSTQNNNSHSILVIGVVGMMLDAAFAQVQRAVRYQE